MKHRGSKNVKEATFLSNNDGLCAVFPGQLNFTQLVSNLHIESGQIRPSFHFSFCYIL